MWSVLGNRNTPRFTNSINYDILYPMNSKEFSLKIESIVKEKRIPYMDAILDFCTQNEVDPGTVGKLVSKSLKEKIKAEAINLKLLKGSANMPQGKLPI